VPGLQVQLFQVDLPLVDGAGRDSQAGGDVEVRVVGTGVPGAGLPVVDEQLPLPAVEQAIRIQPRHHDQSCARVPRRPTLYGERPICRKEQRPTSPVAEADGNWFRQTSIDQTVPQREDVGRDEATSSDATDRRTERSDERSADPVSF